MAVPPTYEQRTCHLPQVLRDPTSLNKNFKHWASLYVLCSGVQHRTKRMNTGVMAETVQAWPAADMSSRVEGSLWSR